VLEKRIDFCLVLLSVYFRLLSICSIFVIPCLTKSNFLSVADPGKSATWGLSVLRIPIGDAAGAVNSDASLAVNFMTLSIN
jgi:hypothetical protein